MTTDTTPIKPFARQGHFTMMDNLIFDELMPQLSPNAWKALCFVIRKTIGWHKDTDNISLSQLMTGTGIKNRTTLTKAITELETTNLIIVIRHDNNVTPNTFALNTKYEATTTGSTENVPPPQGSTEIVPGVVRKSYPQKKGFKETTTTKEIPEKEYHSQIAKAITRVCGFKLNFLIPGTQALKDHSNTVKQLCEWQEPASRVIKFGEWWWGDTPPAPNQIIDNWAKFDAAQNVTPREKRNGTHSANTNGRTSIPLSKQGQAAYAAIHAATVGMSVPCTDI